MLRLAARLARAVRPSLRPIQVRSAHTVQEVLVNMDMGLGALMGGAIGGTWAAAKSLERQVGGYIP